MGENKKKLFLIICYLLVMAAMLGTVSWARYRKELEGTLILPQAADFKSSIRLGTESATEELLIRQLTDFKPGETAADNMAAGKHGVAFTVNNAAITASGTAGKVSDTPISYTLRVYGKGNMPLSMILRDKTGNKDYTATVTETADGYLYTFDDVVGGVPQKEHGFLLQAKTLQENQYVLYLGWHTADKDQEFDDRKYMKEVERLEIRAIVQADYTETDFPTQAPAALEAPLVVPETDIVSE